MSFVEEEEEDEEEISLITAEAEQDIFDVLLSKQLLGRRSARLHRAIAFVSIGDMPVGWICPFALSCLCTYFTCAPPPLVWKFAPSDRLKHLMWLLMAMASLSLSAQECFGVRVMFSKEFREAVQRYTIPTYKGKACPQLLEQFDATYIKVTRMYDTEGSLIRTVWLFVGPLFWFCVAVLAFELWSLPVISLPWLVAPLLTLSISVFHDIVLLPMVLIQVLSQNEAYMVFERIRAYDPNAITRDPQFWQKIFDKHMAMADMLERLWTIASPLFSAYFLMLGSYMIVSTIGILSIVRRGIAAAKIIVGFAILGIVVALLLFRHMAVLAKISTMCFSISCLPEYKVDSEDTLDCHITSIRRAALEKCGFNAMTSNERTDMDRFMNYVRFNPTGVRIFGTTIDTALISSLAFPFFTGFTTIVSYALAHAQVGHGGKSSS